MSQDSRIRQVPVNDRSISNNKKRDYKSQMEKGALSVCVRAQGQIFVFVEQTWGRSGQTAFSWDRLDQDKRMCCCLSINWPVLDSLCWPSFQKCSRYVDTFVCVRARLFCCISNSYEALKRHSCLIESHAAISSNIFFMQQRNQSSQNAWASLTLLSCAL